MAGGHSNNFSTNDPQAAVADDDDHDLVSMVEQTEDQHNVNESGTNLLKRKSDEELTPSSSKKVFTESPNKKIGEIDPNKHLQVYDFLKDLNSDKIVSEYVEKLLDLDFFPIIPCGDKVFLTEPEFEINISKKCHIEVVNLMMNFFQLNYFKNNMFEATSNRKAVINIQSKVFMPCFSSYPQKTFEDMQKINHSAAMQTQSIAGVGAKFNAELMCIRGAHLLYLELKHELENIDHIKDMIQHHFDIHFHKACMEFIRKFKIKKIDWENFQSKIRLLLPKWRRENSAPPINFSNRYANEIEARIQSNTERFDVTSVQNEFEQFVKEGEEAIDKARSTGKLQFSNPPVSSNINNNKNHRPQLPVRRKNFPQRQNEFHSRSNRNHNTTSTYNHHQHRDQKNHHKWNRGHASRTTSSQNVNTTSTSSHPDMPSLFNKIL